MSERGAGGVVMLAVALVVLLFSVALAAVAGVQLARMRATTAADAAALAAAPVTFLPFGATGSPTDEAARFARLNDANLVSCLCPVDRSWEPRFVEVRVRASIGIPIFGDVVVDATGHAEFTPAALLR